jgi:hypothetical protein
MLYASQGARPPKPKPPIGRFLTLLKEADPDIPILKQAKSEYAKVP